MSSVFVDAHGKDFARGVVINDKGEVVSVNVKEYPALSNIKVGMLVLSINGTPLCPSDVREEQKRYVEFAGEILVVLSSTDKDEFDLSSDNDEEEHDVLRTKQSLLPPLPPELDTMSTHNNAMVVLDAANKCEPGKCVIILSENANPALPITLAAEKAGADVMYIDTIARMKTRQKMDDAGEVIKKSLEKGLWIYVEQATKSITLLRKLAECIAEVEMSNKMNKKARVFLMCEPHPHFPEELMKGAITLRSRLQRGVTDEVDIQEDLLESKRRVRVLHGDDLSASLNTLKLAVNNSTTTTTTTSAVKPAVKATKKKVKISSEVNIVHLEKSAFLELSASAQPPIDREAAANNGDGLTRVAKYSFGSNEKFISLCKVRDRRFAVGTNSGYVVLLDGDGLPLIQFRPHKACVWDVSFASQFDFATACEDGTSTIFNYSLVAQELTTTSVASFQSDVFAVTYADDHDINSAVLSGGLSATICVLHSDRQNSSFIASGTSIQAMNATHQRKVIVGGGNGTCSLIDPERCVIVDTMNKHSRKVPAVGSYGNVAATGGFDRMLRLWDIRSNSFHFTCERSIAEVVTAVAVSELYTAVCSGSDLVVYDLRKMSAPLTSKHNAWKDLTRGLVIEGSTIVTASVDGVARFWEVNEWANPSSNNTTTTVK